MIKRIFSVLLAAVLLVQLLPLTVTAAEEQEPYRIFFIGNSYAYDSTHLLYEVYKSQNPDKELQIGVMYYSGCSVEQHLAFISAESAVYDYRYNDSEGNWITVNDVTMDVGLLDQPWDMVVLHEGQGRNAVTRHYTNGQMQTLQKYVCDQLEEDPVFYWNLLWPYPQYVGFQAADYLPQPPEGWAESLWNRTKNDQNSHFKGIAQAARLYIGPETGFSGLLTPGTAIQYANNVLGMTDQDLYRDYTHLSDFGRVIAAHMWYAQLEGLTELTSVNIDAVPASLRNTRFQQYGDLELTEDMKQVVLDSVNYALENPYEVPDPPVTEVPCEQCTTEPEWVEWDGSPLEAADGHYYLTKDLSLTQTLTLADAACSICINLNGHALTHSGRAFQVGSGVTLSIMDFYGTGGVSAQEGVAQVQSGGALFLHSGTLTSDSGSAVWVSGGELSVHGGRIADEVQLDSGSTLNIHSGTLASVTAAGSVNASRSAVIETLTPVADAENGLALGDILTVSGTFAGQIGLALGSTAAAELDVGNSSDTELRSDSLTLVDNTELGVVSNGTDLVLQEKTLCSHCQENVNWIPIDEEDRPTKIMESGHYYLNFAVTSYAMMERLIPAGNSVCLNLNGKGIQGIARAFKLEEGATLTLLGTGSIKGRGTYSFEDGGTVYVSPGATLNLYEATIGSQLGVSTDRTAGNGGVLAVYGTFNMYGGKVDPTTSTTPRAWPEKGGAIYVGDTGTFNMYGGQVSTCSGTAVAPCVYAEAGGRISLSGSATISELYFAESSAGSLAVEGIYSGTLALRYPDTVTLSDLSDVGNSIGGDVSLASISFPDAQGKTAAVKGTDLVVSDSAGTYGSCPACGECRWQAITDADLDTMAKFGMTPGHYRLAEDVLTVQKQLNGEGLTPGTYCIDLAGHTFTGSSRGFLVYDDATLNIIDTLGGGVMAGQASAAAGGGVLYATTGGTINLYGGTLRHTNVNSDVTLAGGAVRVNGGAFRLYGGRVEGGNVTTYGGAVYVTQNGGTLGTFAASGGEITAGTAETDGPCVYVGAGCTVTLSGDADIAQLTFGESSADTLTVEGSFTGTVALDYPDTVALSLMTDVGNSLDGDISSASISFTGISCITVRVSGSDLVVAAAADGHEYTSVVTVPTCTEQVKK